jgi:hypothetical protein
MSAGGYIRDIAPRHRQRPAEAIRRMLQVARMDRQGVPVVQIAHRLGTTVPIVESYLDITVSELRQFANQVGEVWP